MGCLEEIAIEAWLQRRASATQVDEYEEHLDGCAACRELIASCLLDPVVETLAGASRSAQAWPIGVPDEAATVEEATLIRVDLSDSNEGPKTERARLTTGTMVAQFCIMSLLGCGGMAEVYLARDVGLGRKVALKWFDRSRFSSAFAGELFMREVRTTAKFNHPHIVTIHAAGQVADGPLAGGAYVALEYIRGIDLRRRLCGGPVSTEMVIRIATAIGRALIEAHRHGVLHCDLKPGNVMLATTGEIRVVDFGLALRSSPAESTDVMASFFGGTAQNVADGTVTRDRSASAADSHSLGGSPRYLAPEQWYDDPCTDKTDMWAVGLIVYEMLVGEHPFADCDMLALASRVTDPVPVPPLTVGPPAIVELVNACLNKTPQRRPSAKQFVAVLEQA